jgi:hypothetical protein
MVVAEEALDALDQKENLLILVDPVELDLLWLVELHLLDVTENQDLYQEQDILLVVELVVEHLQDQLLVVELVELAVVEVGEHPILQVPLIWVVVEVVETIV